jgi:hypothetical protein
VYLGSLSVSLANEIPLEQAPAAADSNQLHGSGPAGPDVPFCRQESNHREPSDDKRDLLFVHASDIIDISANIRKIL